MGENVIGIGRWQENRFCRVQMARESNTHLNNKALFLEVHFCPIK
jgi:hypothetical protein